jgi:hypothetical protein
LFSLARLSGHNLLDRGLLPRKQLYSCCEKPLSSLDKFVIKNGFKILTHL